MISIWPKYYEFTIYLDIGEDKTAITLCSIVARNKQNAVRFVKGSIAEDASLKKQAYAVHMLQESWLGKLGILLLPRYQYTNKRQWEVIEL